MKPRVLITVEGGIAEYDVAGEVEIKFIDFDDLYSEGVSRDDMDTTLTEAIKWLKAAK